MVAHQSKSDYESHYERLQLNASETTRACTYLRVTASNNKWLKMTTRTKSNYGWTIFMNDWCHFDVFWGGTSSYFWNRFFYEVVRHLILIKKIATSGANYIEFHHFENRKCLKIAIFCLKCCVRVICVFFVPLLAWGRITPQIIQKNLIIVIILLRSTLLAPEVRKWLIL